MCNLGEGIWERAYSSGYDSGIDKTVEILNMYSKGYTLEQIATATNMAFSKIEKILNAAKVCL